MGFGGNRNEKRHLRQRKEYTIKDGGENTKTRSLSKTINLKSLISSLRQEKDKEEKVSRKLYSKAPNL